MTDEDLEALMRATGTEGYPSDVRRLVEAVRALERERCAKVCEEIDARCPECAGHNDHDQCVVPAPWQYAEAIRGA